MAMLEQRIQQQFFDSADLKYQAAESLTRPIADAAQAMVGCLTSGSKLLVYGQGASQLLARYIVGALVGRFERERPGLAAIEIGACAIGVSAAATAATAHLHALGLPGDLLLLLATDTSDSALGEVVRQAHGKDISVVALIGHALGSLEAVIGETDVLIAVPHERHARVHEMHLLIVHGLCDAVDLQLMGEENSE